jgi:hypothetical protein
LITQEGNELSAGEVGAETEPRPEGVVVACTPIQEAAAGGLLTTHLIIILVIVAAVILLIVVIAIVICCCCCGKRRYAQYITKLHAHCTLKGQ